MSQKGFVSTAVLIVILVLMAIGGAYYLGTQKNLQTSVSLNSVSPSNSPTPTQTASVAPTSSSVTPDVPANWKIYTSTTEKASFGYPPEWIVTKPSIETNDPNADEIAVQSPNGGVKVSWVSLLSGFGGGCNKDVPLGSTDGCPLVTVISKTPIKNATNLYVVSGTITQDGQVYEPFLAVQDNTVGELISTGRTMGYDMFTGRNNGSLPESGGHNAFVLFSTGDAYARGPSLTQSAASSWFDKPEVQQAKQILLSLTYTQ